MSRPLRVGALEGRSFDPELRPLFQRLNDQLGVVLAQAELLESRAANDFERARASHVVASVFEALATAKLIRHCSDRSDAGR